MERKTLIWDLDRLHILADRYATGDRSVKRERDVIGESARKGMEVLDMASGDQPKRDSKGYIGGGR